MSRKKQLEKVDLASDLRRAEEYIVELELSRDLTQTIVHVDCDAFYAAVEEIDRPELKHVPMAVGQGVLTTCNYHARKYGCRSAMAGFVAMKLCPQLICLPLNFAKYTAKAQEVRAILADYDPQFESASMDEAYLNITDYCQEQQMDPADAVTKLRREIEEKTKITVSAGIAANAKIAKISSNKNKPNGQFRVANDRATIIAFMRDLPTRKVNGIGRVFERELDAIGVKTCGDIYAHRAYLSKLFGHKAFQFLMQTYLGLGRTSVQPPEESERKSIGTESTFREMSGKEELRAKLRWIAEELEKDLSRTQFKGRTLVLKIKLHTYEVFTRQMAPPKAINTADDLYKHALPMLSKYEREIPGMRLRLMGLRCTHLVSTKKIEVDFFGMRRVASTENRSPVKRANTDNEGWQIWPEEEFEEAARQERQEEMEEAERLSQDQQGPGEAVDPNELNVPDIVGRKRLLKQGCKVNLNTENKEQSNSLSEREPEAWACPICGLPQPAHDREFNDHIDYCLSRQTIKEAAKASSPPSDTTFNGKDMMPGKRKATIGDSGEAKKRFFFGK